MLVAVTMTTRLMLGLQLLCLFVVCKSCPSPEKNISLSDQVERSDVVLRVVATFVTAAEANARYDATFRVTGTFGAKSGSFGVNDHISLGPFGDKPSCVPIEAGEEYVVFIKEDPAMKNDMAYLMQYNPIPLSDVSVPSVDGNDLEQSKKEANTMIQIPCPELKPLSHGSWQCNLQETWCEIVCDSSYQLVCESEVQTDHKTCLRGKWEPSANCDCREIEEGDVLYERRMKRQISGAQKPKKQKTTLKPTKPTWRRTTTSKKTWKRPTTLKATRKTWKRPTTATKTWKRRSTAKPWKRTTTPTRRTWSRTPTPKSRSGKGSQSPPISLPGKAKPRDLLGSKALDETPKRPLRRGARTNRRPGARTTPRSPKSGGKTTKRPARRPGSRTTARPRGRTTPRAGGRTTPRTGGRTTPRTGGRTTPRTGGRTTPRTGGRTTPRTGGRTTPRTGGRTTPRAGGRTTPRTGGRTTPRTGGRTTPRTGGRTTPRAGGRTTPRTGGRTTPRAGGRTTPRTGGRTTPRAGGRSSGRTGARTTRRPFARSRKPKIKATTTTIPTTTTTTTPEPTTTTTTTPAPTTTTTPIPTTTTTTTPEPTTTTRPTLIRPIQRIRPVPQGGIPRVITNPDPSQTLMTFGDSVVGCPTFKGQVKLYSVWRGGLNGAVEFKGISQPVRNGWMLQVSFNVPVQSLKTFNADSFQCGRENAGQEYCLVPKEYIENIDAGRDLTISFTGKTSGQAGVRIRGATKLMGMCQTSMSQGRKFRDLIPSSVPNGNIREEGNGEEKASSSVPARAIEATRTQSPKLNPIIPSRTSTSDQGRCGAFSPNGGSPEDYGQTEPQWEKRLESGVDLNEILHKSILFYEAQRSGKLPSSNRIPWRGDSDLQDGCSSNMDLSGGWYNSGGNVKTTLLTAFATTMLAWGGIEYIDAYDATGELEKLAEEIRWAADYLMKCHPSPDRLVVQVGDYTSSSRDWRRPEESDPSLRKVYTADASKPAGDVAAEASAALAAVSMLFETIDSEYSATCLRHSRELYRFAKKHPKPFPYNPKSRMFWYSSKHGSHDELAWAATWLHRATDEEEFLVDAEEAFHKIVYNSASRFRFSWNQKAVGVATLLAALSARPSAYRDLLLQFGEWTLGQAPRTPQGLLYLSFRSPSMYAANSAFICLQVAKILEESDLTRNLTSLAREQMGLLVGRDGQGFVVGVGANAPERPHHRGSTCPAPPQRCTRAVTYQNRPNANILYGALLTGPNRIGRFRDRASNYIYANVRINHNAGFQSLAAGLIDLSQREEAE